MIIVEGTVMAKTDKAAMILLEGGAEEWFPFSHCPDLEDCEKEEQVTFECPEWLITAKGLEEYL